MMYYDSPCINCNRTFVSAAGVNSHGHLHHNQIYEWKLPLYQAPTLKEVYKEKCFSFCPYCFDKFRVYRVKQRGYVLLHILVFHTPEEQKLIHFEAKHLTQHLLFLMNNQELDNWYSLRELSFPFSQILKASDYTVNWWELLDLDKFQHLKVI